jgi:hypothetical protein
LFALFALVAGPRLEVAVIGQDMLKDLMAGALENDGIENTDPMTNPLLVSPRAT